MSSLKCKIANFNNCEEKGSGKLAGILRCVVDAEACSVGDSLSAACLVRIAQGGTSLSEKLVWLETGYQSRVE